MTTTGGAHARQPELPPRDELAATRIFLRPIANPFPLGFLGLAGATLLLAGQDLNWLPPSQKFQVALIIMVFAPVLQLVACVFGFLGRDPVAATGMGILAVTWGLIGGVHWMSPPGSHSPALGTLLFLSATAILLSAAAAARGKIVPALVMTITACRWIATGLFEVSGYHPYQTAAGYVGCVLAFVAVYAAFAIELENVRHRAVLPVLRRHRGRTALEPYLSEQVKEVAAEPGVRNQL
jgi:succinate-acetate transporter protein